MPDLARIDVGGAEVLLRTAVQDDLPVLVAMLAADQHAAARDGIRDDADLARYRSALAAIDADPAHLLVVAVLDGAPVGTFQLSFLPGLARRGSLRAQVEAVRLDPSVRGRGIGSALMRWAVAESRARGCSLVQLTTDKRRGRAHEFYRRLGFEASHEGMKLRLDG